MTLADRPGQAAASADGAISGTARAVEGAENRLIDHWFPCAAVDEAVGTPAGSGRSEKALFTWFASRPVAQARAAVLTTLLPDHDTLRGYVNHAIRGQRGALDHLAEIVARDHPDAPPVVLDVFSGRGIIPLEAARIGATAVGIDLSPVATLGGRLLADFPFRDWSSEPPLPFKDPAAAAAAQARVEISGEPRLLHDVRMVLAEVGRRLIDAVAPFYPTNPDGHFPWAYLWAVTMPCDRCKRRFPLVGSLVLRHPYLRTQDIGQALRLLKRGDDWYTEVIDGAPDQEPTFAAPAGRKGKSAVCLFCSHPHSLDAIKQKGKPPLSQFQDAILAVADGGDSARKTWRRPRPDEITAANAADDVIFVPFGKLSAMPDEPIPVGNEDTIRASGYGYSTYGDLMNNRHTIQFVETVRAIRDIHAELLTTGINAAYAAALAGYAVANMQRRLRRSTRGAKLLCHGKPSGADQNRVQAHDVFADESKVSFQFDYLETGPGDGPGTWSSVAEPGLNALRKVLEENRSGRPGRFRRASATALPYRDNSVLAVVTDPPYYNMIDYLDASDLFYVWFQRALFDVMPDLFGTPGLQDKSDEIIVKRGNAPGEHRTVKAYEEMLGKAFREAKRVIRPDGHLVVVFGHSDPDAWRRLLGALHEAGFVVTSSWPSRTETANTGVASIKVTVTIGCRVARPDGPVATASQVDREVLAQVKQRVREWDRDGLALPDQLMAAYGPAMEVYGRYAQVLRPDGTTPALEHYLTLARAAVRDATALRLDELPLDTFDAGTRFAVFWLRLYGRTDVPKGEARFAAQVDGLNIDDLRGPLLTESRAGFRLRTDAADALGPASCTFEVARTLAAAWDAGGTDAVAAAIASAGRDPADRHLWAVVKDMAAQLPGSDSVAKALAAVTRNASTIGSMVKRQAATEHVQLALSDD
jgi:adenine-specific DNA methylase